MNRFGFRSTMLTNMLTGQMSQKNSEKKLYFNLSKENIKKNNSSCAILNKRKKRCAFEITSH